MKSFDKYIAAYQKIVAQYEKEHPYWYIEVLVSLIKRGLKSLKHYIEDDRDPEITWEAPFAELHYPINWNWKQKRADDSIAPGGHIFGKFTRRNTATKELVTKTIAKTMGHQLDAVTLANATNWAWYEKLKNYYTPVLPVQLAAELSVINSKRERRKYFDQLVRPFSIGAARLDFDCTNLKSGTRVPKRVRNKLAEIQTQMDVPPIKISGDVNGRKFEAHLVFEIQPMIADYDRRKRPRFLLDLAEELTWLKDNTGADVAERWYQALLVTIQFIKKNPFIGRERKDLKPAGIRSWRMGGFPRWLIFYAVTDAGKVVFHRVRSGTMNLVVLKMES